MLVEQGQRHHCAYQLKAEYCINECVLHVKSILKDYANLRINKPKILLQNIYLLLCFKFTVQIYG